MQGIVSVFGGASLAECGRRTKGCVQQISILVTFGCYVRQAQLIGESCGGKASVGKQKQLFENAMRKGRQDNGSFMIVNGKTMAVDNSVLFSLHTWLRDKAQCNERGQWPSLLHG
jgi:hypothetical protein